MTSVPKFERQVVVENTPQLRERLRLEAMSTDMLASELKGDANIVASHCAALFWGADDRYGIHTSTIVEAVARLSIGAEILKARGG